jgi:hypothetical protein
MSKAWAVPTWLFLHTLAAHLPQHKYPELKTDVLFQIKNICAVLPCPDCAQHATQYLSQLKVNHIPTKESLKIVLWKFHNVVNLQTNKPLYPIESLDIYDRSNLAVMYNMFLTEFTRPIRNPKLMMDVLTRDRIIINFKVWMHKVFGL